jgi:hypothetical protein
MKINEVSDSVDPKPDRLVGLVRFLTGRAQDTASRKQISKKAFINMARQLGIVITPDNLGSLAEKPPLSNLVEPIMPDSNVVVFKGEEQQPPAGMPVDQARQVVKKMANRANSLTKG